MPRVALLAPDSFKGTLSASDVANALADGFAAEGWSVDLCPVADGGEGTVDALCGDGQRVRVPTMDPIGRPIVATFGWLDGVTAVIETAAASGLTLVPPQLRDAELASTRGTGEVIARAIHSGARRILLGCGGSATTDGGRGAVEAIEQHGGLRGARLELLTDVRVPFEDAAIVFAGQKGADNDAIERLTRRLGALAAAMPRDPRGVPGTGAAGGLAGGLWAHYDARIVDGAAAVLDAVGFTGRAAAADLVVTGEGCIDEQTLHGKLVSHIARRCRVLKVRCLAVVGRNALPAGRDVDLGLSAVITAGDRDALIRVAGLLPHHAIPAR